jgi:hypothetical protein
LESNVKVAIVQASSLASHNTWDPKEFLGRIEDKEEELTKAKRALYHTRLRVARAHKALEEEKKRMQALQESGEVKLIEK